MTDTEKLELRRKGCTALYPGKDIRIEASHVWICDRAVDSEGWISKRTAPALESDSGLALDAADSFCRSRKLWWNMGSGCVEDGREYYYFNIGETRDGNAYTVASCEGETPAEAICKAIIASVESIRKAGK